MSDFILILKILPHLITIWPLKEDVAQLDNIFEFSESEDDFLLLPGQETVE